jgi:hypothetical protein
MYVALWQKAEALGVGVTYDGSLSDGEGWFHPDPSETGDGSPSIVIGRPYYQEPSFEPSQLRNVGGQALPTPDLRAEIVTLAHELGHFLSWKGPTSRDRWLTYFEAVKARDQAWSALSYQGSVDQFNEMRRAAAQVALTPTQLGHILEEEELAWVLGRELLEALGFDAVDYYAERMRKGLHFHRYRLGLDDLWEDDVPPIGGRRSLGF